MCWDEANGDGVKIRLERRGQQLEAVHLNGYFRALCAIREQLEVEGSLLECFGASKDVYPSPMIESMGYGEKAYKLTLGRAALKSDLVGIFESGEDVAPATVEEQREFYEQWLESLR